MQENDEGFKAVEIFRNIDAAEAYYSHFMKNKGLVCRVLCNLPYRQSKGPTAVVGDGNVQAWITGTEDTLKLGPQTAKYNHLKWAGAPGEKVEVEYWSTPPSIADLEAKFGKFHFGFTTNPTAAETESEPRQLAME